MQNVFNFTQGVNVVSVMDQITKVVGSTLGPNGKYNVINVPGRGVHTTKDGVTCLRYLESNDDYINAIISIIKEASENTLKKAGDGTTSTILIANELLKGLTNGTIKEDKLKTKVQDMITELPSLTKKVTEETIKKVIFTSVAGDKELSNLIYEAYSHSDRGHNISVFTELGQKSNVEIINGISFNVAPASESFNRENIQMNNPLVVAYSGIIESEREVVEFIEVAKKHNYKDIVILSTAYSEEALSVFSINHAQNVINVLPLVVSGGGLVQNKDLVSILSATTGIPMLGQEFASYLYDFNFDEVNVPEKILYNNKVITIEGIKTDLPYKLIEEYTNKLKSAKSDKEMNLMSFILSILKRKMVKVTIGANIESKIKELKDRVDDALHSIRNAFEYGIVKGAGQTYIELNNKTSDSIIYEKIFSVIQKQIGVLKRQDEVFDSVKVIEYVLKSSLELSLLLNNISGVIVIYPKK